MIKTMMMKLTKMTMGKFFKMMMVELLLMRGINGKESVQVAVILLKYNKEDIL